MKSYKKYILMFLLFILIIFLTFHSIFDGKSFSSTVDSIKQIKKVYIFICLIIILLYFLLQGIYMKIILKSLNTSISIRKGLFYSLIEFYFSGITPSSTGGQPVQLYFMTKDKIPMRKSYITLMLNTIFFKIIILILGVAVLLFYSNYLFSHSIIYIICFLFGFIIDSVLVFACILLLFRPKYIKKILNLFVRIGSKIKFLNKKVEKINVTKILSKYRDEIRFINNNKLLVFLTFILTFIQRLLLFSIAFVVYKSLGFSKYGYFDLLMIQVCVQVAIEALPIPGGAGLSEKMFHDIFITLFGLEVANVGMLLTRMFSFYIPLLISGIISAIVIIKGKKRYLNDTKKL